ncbi:Immunity protein 30 [Butyrivibrio sp. INlla18]|uniref:Imm30 family immunity protein n=1 Tax=Butyrivibrio sp. INlla18 TaxID=1520806 RepID=UPI0008904C63|nr:Imm30 family immunity protein [Butyrivibrio sp. INlla18]SDA73447.1 Immunity protein 30 [Butyrivibrio sp. INlla18]
MKNEIIDALKQNRLLRNQKEIRIFENALERLAFDYSEDDIAEICEIFDDDTNDTEVMFGMVHLLETISTKKAYLNTIYGIVSMYKKAPEWAKTILYRCLNDDCSVEMIKQLYTNLPQKIKISFSEILETIKNEDKDMFGDAIDRIMFGTN